MNALKIEKEEIANIISSKKILKKIGLGSLINVKKVCQEVGISRKSAYGYNNQCSEKKTITDDPSSKDLKGLKEENDLLKARLKEVELENQGLRISRKIVEELKKKKLI